MYLIETVVVNETERDHVPLIETVVAGETERDCVPH